MSDFNLHFYDDIINLPHHRSKNHPPMKSSDRAAQFGAFSALTGHSDAIAETGRLTTPEHEISEYVMGVIDAHLQVIKDSIDTLPKIKVTYFSADTSKPGGSYKDYEGRIRRIDEVNKILIFEDATEIRIDTIYSIESELVSFNEEFDNL